MWLTGACLNIMIYEGFSWHCREIIRRKAVLALYKFYLIAPNQVQHIHNKFRKALCDKDPGVMTASLHIYLQMIQVICFSGLYNYLWGYDFGTILTAFVEKTLYRHLGLIYGGIIQLCHIFLFCYRRIQKVIRTWQQVLSPYWSKWWEESCPWILTIIVSRLHGCKFSSSEYCLYLGKMTKGDYYWFCPLMNWMFMLSGVCALYTNPYK